MNSHTLSDSLGGLNDVLGISGSLLSFGLVLVKLHKFGEIELGLLEDLDLSNHAVVLEWVDFAALSLDLFANFFFEATD